MSGTVGPDQEPWTELPRPSTTSGPEGSKIRRPRRAHLAGRRQATPHRLAGRYGLRTPVTLTLRLHIRADIWVEVITDQGRFFVPFDSSVVELVKQVIRGGHTVEALSTTLDREHRSGKGHLGNQTPTD